MRFCAVSRRSTRSWESRSRCCSRPPKNCAKSRPYSPKMSPRTTAPFWRKWTRTTPARWLPRPALNPRLPGLNRGVALGSEAEALGFMILQALLVSNDDLAAETLIQVQTQFGVAVDRLNAADVAVARLEEQRFDQVIVDFDDPETASLVLESCRRLGGSEHKAPVTVALLHDASQIRSILGARAHFILVQPITREQAQNTLRAATALLKRERRQSLRVAIQAAVSIRTDDHNNVEGILLDLSTGGMDVLAAKPLPATATVRVSFELPDGGAGIEGDAEVAWSTGNGQSGLRFLDMDPKMRQQMGDWLKE